MNYKLKIKITEDDYLNLNYDFLLKKKSLIILLIIAILLIIIPSILRIPYLKTPGQFVKEFLPIVLIILIWFVFIKILWPNKLKKLYASDESMQEEHELEISENEINQIMERGTIRFYAREVKKIIYGKKLISIFVSKQKALIIPRHCFQSKEEEMEIEQFIKNNFDKN